MKLARTRDGRLIAVRGDQALEVGSALGASGPDPLLSYFDGGGTLERLLAVELDGLPMSPVSAHDLAAPIGRPHKIIGAPVNYLDHKVEMNEQKTIAEYGVFLKANSSVLAPGGDIRLPYTDQRTDQEGELAIVIGRRAHHVTAAQALEFVFGYTAVLDITVRSTEDRSTRKSYDTFTPLGPWIVTADEIPDPDSLDLKCWVGGELRQHTNTRDLIFSVADLVSYASHVMTLEPGDIIASGTPAGVGAISAGQEVAVEIERIGRLSVGVSDDHAIPYAERPGPGRRA